MIIRDSVYGASQCTVQAVQGNPQHDQKLTCTDRKNACNEHLQELHQENTTRNLLDGGLSTTCHHGNAQFTYNCIITRRLQSPNRKTQAEHHSANMKNLQRLWWYKCWP